MQRSAGVLQRRARIGLAGGGQAGPGEEEDEENQRHKPEYGNDDAEYFTSIGLGLCFLLLMRHGGAARGALWSGNRRTLGRRIVRMWYFQG